MGPKMTSRSQLFDSYEHKLKRSTTQIHEYVFSYGRIVILAFAFNVSSFKFQVSFIFIFPLNIYNNKT